MMNILNWLNVIAMVMKLLSFFKSNEREKAVELTRTDKLIDATDMAEKIKNDMDSCGYIILDMIDGNRVIKEGDETRKEGIKDVFTDMGMPDEIFKQVENWARTSQYFWASYSDELKILCSNLPKEMKDDVIKHKVKRKKKKLNKRKLKKIHDKYAVDDGAVKNKAGLEALEKLAKDLDRMKPARGKSDKSKPDES